MDLAEELPTATYQGTEQQTHQAAPADPAGAIDRSSQKLMRNQIIQAFNEEVPSNLIKMQSQEDSQYDMSSMIQPNGHEAAQD